MQLTRKAFGITAALCVGISSLACATTDEAEHVRVIHPAEQVAESGGIAPDKQADIQLLLQQREPSTTKCYSDVLNDKHDRAFKGTVAVIISLEPAGQVSQATDVRIANSTLDNKEVHDCLIERLKGFEYPQIDHKGSMQYVYRFQPAY